jgi:DNA-binding transcriptional LysR family regulator
VNIRFLETVLWLARLRTIKATADQLCITHTAISNRIAALEQDLGVKLFKKSGLGFEPTLAGAKFIDEAAGIVEAYHRLRRVMLDPSKLKGSLRIGLATTLAPTLFPHLANILRDEYPGVALSVTVDLADRLLHEMRAQRLDLILVSEWSQDQKFESVPLCSYAMGIVGSPSLSIDCSKPVGLEQLASYAFIGYPPGTKSQARVENYFSGVNLVGGLHASNGVNGNVYLALAGMGITAVPIVLVKNELEQGSLLLLPTVKPYVSVHYAAVFAQDDRSELPRAVAALARQAASRFCEAADPSQAWQDQPTHSSEQQ